MGRGSTAAEFLFDGMVTIRLAGSLNWDLAVEEFFDLAVGRGHYVERVIAEERLRSMGIRRGVSITMLMSTTMLMSLFLFRFFD